MTGVVALIDDRVPVDGGATITLEVEGGGTKLLTFASLFTDPPPGKERHELCRKITEAKVESRETSRAGRGRSVQKFPIPALLRILI